MKRLLVSVFLKVNRADRDFVLSRERLIPPAGSGSPESWRLGLRECVYISSFFGIFSILSDMPDSTVYVRLCLCVSMQFRVKSDVGVGVLKLQCLHARIL